MTASAGGTVGVVTVFVLMADGGYDGDSLLGVYATSEEADAAGEAWAPGSAFDNYSWYVLPVEMGEAAELRFQEGKQRV